MRLIDADKLREKAQWMEMLDNQGIIFDIRAVSVSSIDLAPTLDAVEVVRCKDCVHYDLGGCLKIYSDGAASKYAWQTRNEDDFCSYGRRK